MDDQKIEQDRKGCIEDCDKKFIDCVESLRQDCLERFGSCASDCKI
jgi:hypothetical protein